MNAKTRKEIVEKINEKITVINDLIDEVSSIGWDIHSLFEVLYPDCEYEESNIKNANDRAIFVQAIKCGMLSGDNYSFGKLEMLDDEHEYAKWQWDEILSIHFKNCLGFWNKHNGIGDELGMSEGERYHMAYLDLLNCNANPFSPNGMKIPDDIKEDFVNNNHSMKFAKKQGPIRLEVVNRAIEAGYGGWEKYKEKYYSNN